MLIGYARVSTAEQSLDLQIDALKKAGCERVLTDVASGAQAARPGLEEALAFLRAGDALVVWRLDRLGRSLSHLIENIRALAARDVGFRSLQESIDTTTSGGKLVFHVFGALAEFERDLIRDRTQAGLVAARARGRQGGRPRALDEKKAALARSMYADLANKPRDICRALKISRATLYRYLGPRAGPGQTSATAQPEVESPTMRALGKPATTEERERSTRAILRATECFGLPVQLGSDPHGTTRQ
jgi:DNA invertase Pin-like site-specific DNA recombinase